jgi:hypothetical protein
MTTKPKTRKAPAAAIDPVFAAIAEHKALIMEYIRCRNNSHTARAQAEKKHGKSLEGAALFIAAAEDTTLEYDQFNRAARAERKAAMRARTKPTTASGAAAMITHTRRENGGHSRTLKLRALWWSCGGCARGNAVGWSGRSGER